MRKQYKWAILLLVVAGGTWYFFHGSKESDGKSGKHGKGGAAVPVAVAAAKTGDISVFLEGLGNITPTSTITVHTLVNGELMNIAFQEGQMVKKDDLLAKIDDRPYTAALEQAEGALKRDEALLAEAKIDLIRYQVLWKKDSIAKQQVDLQASLVQQYEGDVINDRGQVDAAKTNLIYTEITSPVTGRVGLRQVDAGNIVHTSDSNGIVVVTELQPITAIFTVPEDNIHDVQKHTDAGEKLVAEAWSRDDKTKIATGTLVATDNQVDPTTGTVKLRAEFANEDNSLFPDQFVNIHLKLDTLKNVVIIPTAAVQRGTHGTFAYVAQSDSTVAVKNITLGPSEGENVVATDGVGVGDQLVIDGADSLRDGAKIEIASGKDKDADASKDSAASSDKSDTGQHGHHKDKDSSDKTPDKSP